MLFAVKPTPGSAIAALTGFGIASVALHGVFGLAWAVHPSVAVLRDATIGLLGLLALDGIGHRLLTALIGDPYRRRFRAFAQYFEGQSSIAVGTGGLLAAGEELFFRGVLLTLLLRTTDPVAPVGAITLSALVFGAFHITLRSIPAVFTVWAVWEGLLLGGLYLVTGSLLVVAVTHALHDTVGFYALRRWRYRDAPLVGADTRE